MTNKSRAYPLEEPHYGTALQATYVGFEGEEYDANRARPASTAWALLFPCLMVAVAFLKAFGVIQ